MKLNKKEVAELKSRLRVIRVDACQGDNMDQIYAMASQALFLLDRKDYGQENTENSE